MYIQKQLWKSIDLYIAYMYADIQASKYYLFIYIYVCMIFIFYKYM
jgi:hypothetical protein